MKNQTHLKVYGMSGAEAIITSKYANDKKKEEMLTNLSIEASPIQTSISSLH